MTVVIIVVRSSATGQAPLRPGSRIADSRGLAFDGDGRRYHTRQHLMARRQPPEPGTYTWVVEYDGHCVGSAGLRVDPDQHCATYTVGLFVAALRGRGLAVR